LPEKVVNVPGLTPTFKEKKIGVKTKKKSLVLSWSRLKKKGSFIDRWVPKLNQILDGGQLWGEGELDP